MRKLFNKVVSLLEQIRRDRLYHFIFGLVLGAFNVLCVDLSGLVSLLIVAGVGIAKEIFDKLSGSSPDFVDFAYTFGGGLLISVFFWI